MSLTTESEEKIMTRKEQMNDIKNLLTEGIATFFTSERYAELLRIYSCFHNYSFNNALLIAMQMPSASYVAGYTTWKNKFNRVPAKGSKAIRIIAPCPITIVNDDAEEIEKFMYFRPANVFDYSQTIPIPETEQVELDIRELTGDVSDYDRLISTICNICPSAISFADIPGTARGYYSPATNEIVIQTGMSQLQTIKTLIHEYAHSILHSPEQVEIHKPSRETKEIEAESTTFIVCNLLGGMDTSDYSFEYIAGWEGKDNLKTLNHSMSLIMETANKIYDSIISNLNC